MNPWIAELIGTMILIVLGNGVVANVVLSKTKGNGGGPIVITVGWGIAVFVGALCSEKGSGAHLNPALTLALAAAGKFEMSRVMGYVLAQMLGAIIGACLVYYFYRAHFDATKSGDDKLACFSTSPNIAGNLQAFFCEVIGTFVLVLPILLMQKPSLEHLAGEAGKAPVLGLGTIGLLPVAILVCGIGLSLGGTTGYAINPARDLGPRLAHHFLPIAGKRDSNWSYAWVPVAGPFVGGLVAAIVFRLIG